MILPAIQPGGRKGLDPGRAIHYQMAHCGSSHVPIV